MKIEIFALCDAATDSFGKLNILGTFETIYAASAPVEHPACAVALRLRFERIERGEHTIQLNVIDADGNLMLPAVKANARVQFPDKLNSHATNLILNFQRLKLPKFGEYSIDLALDNRQEASLPLVVRQRAEK